MSIVLLSGIHQIWPRIGLIVLSVSPQDQVTSRMMNDISDPNRNTPFSADAINLLMDGNLDLIDITVTGVASSFLPDFLGLPLFSNLQLYRCFIKIIVIYFGILVYWFKWYMVQLG